MRAAGCPGRSRLPIIVVVMGEIDWRIRESTIDRDRKIRTERLWSYIDCVDRKVAELDCRVYRISRVGDIERLRVSAQAARKPERTVVELIKTPAWRRSGCKRSLLAGHKELARGSCVTLRQR